MSLHGNSVEERIWNYLYEKIGNKFGVAGLMGNLYAESGLIFNRVEMLCLKRLKENGKTYTDVTYTADVDSGKISRAEFLNPLPGKVYGYSIAQWTSTNRKAGLYDSAKAKGVSIADEENCLEFLLTELNGSYKSVMSVLKNAKSVREASDIVLKKFEVPANMGTSVQEKRASYGQNYYNKYAKINGVSSLGGNTMTESEFCRKVATWLDSYLGCAEGSAKHREILSIFNNSRLCTRYTMTVNDAWCATAVSAAFIACGLTSIFPCVECSCNNMITKAKNAGIWIENDAYIPKVGDVILYDWQDNGVGDNMGSSDHVGIVYSVSGNSFVVIEGNYSNTVKKRNLVVNQRCIRGFIAPKYSSKATSSTPSTPSTPSKPTTSTSTKLNSTVKWKGTTITELNVRKWAGTENATCSFSPLKAKVSVDVCDSVKAKDGSTWYYIKYNGKYGFVHSSYVRSTSASASSPATSSSKVEGAQNFNKAIAGTYKVTSSDGLNLRLGAGTSKGKILAIPSGGTVKCYGYYNVSGGVKWYYVAYKTYTGYVSSQYLKKQ